MKNSIKKDYKYRLLVKNLELKRYILKSILKNSNFIYTTRWNISTTLNRLNKFSSKTVLVNRCILTGKNRIFFNLCLVSRLKFLKLAKLGHLYGIKKSCW